MLHRRAQPHNCDVASLTFAGPIGYAAFVLPRDADAAPALQGLLDRIDAGTIELLDLEILALGAHGAAERQPTSVLQHGDSFDLSEFDGAQSDLLDAEDLAALGAELSDSELAIVIIYEDRGLAGFAAQVQAQGGRELWTGGVDISELDTLVTESEQEN